MERKLLQAFDRQRFQPNARLAGIIGDVESRYAHALADDDLEMVSAAGTADQRAGKPWKSIPPSGRDESEAWRLPRGGKQEVWTE